MNYAEATEVSVDRSRAEIERTVMRYGATGFVSGWRLWKGAALERFWVNRAGKQLEDA